MDPPSQPRMARMQSLRVILLPLLHPDVLSLIAAYEATIEMKLVRTVGSLSTKGNGVLKGPRGLTVYGEELFVADTSNNRIQVFQQQTGHFLRMWGAWGFGNGKFIMPQAITIDSRNPKDETAEIFILSCLPVEIQVFRILDGHFLRPCRLPSYSCVPRLRGIALLDNHLFCSMAKPSQVDVIEKSDGKHIATLGGPLVGLNHPRQLFIDPDSHDLFIADTGNNRIVVFHALSGHLLKGYQDSKLANPQGVAVHGEQVIVSNAGNNSLVVFDRATGGMRQVIGCFGKNLDPPQLHFPSDLIINTRGELFVCDTFNRRILVFE